MIRQLQSDTAQHAPVWFVLCTLFISVTMEFLPWSDFLLQVKPAFPALALIFWALHYPRFINYAAAVVIGIIIDLSNQTALGVNAAGYAVIILFTNIFYGRFVLLGPLSQAFQVLIILSAGQLTVFALGLIEGGAWERLRLRLFWPAATAAMLWLALPLMMRYLRGFLSRGERHGDF